MKITGNIDCTPAEIRELLGLPDVRPLQEAWLAEIEKKMMAELESFSPEGLARNWLSSSSASVDWIPSVFGSVLRERGSKESDEKG